MAVIQVSNGFFLIDDEDLSILSEFRKPIINENGYVVMMKRGGGHKTYRLHRVLMNCPVGLEVDHINHVRNDNRRCNLRICTVSENRRNSLMKRHNKSGYRGVSLYKRDGNYEAYFRLNGKKKRIGYFDDPIQAARAYDEAIKKHYGEFGILNGV